MNDPEASLEELFRLNQWNDIPMPLLMGFQFPEKIQEVNYVEPIMYDPVSQIVYYDMRTVGTKCLKTSQTKPKYNTDRKNEIDDVKVVK